MERDHSAAADAAGVDLHLAALERERDAIGAVNLRAEEEATEQAARLNALRTERADLANADLLGSMMSQLFKGLDPGPMVTEIQARIGEELDYRVEATNQRAFAEFYRRGERTVGLGVDTQNETGATRLYDQAGMHAVYRAVIFQKRVS